MREIRKSVILELVAGLMTQEELKEEEKNYSNNYSTFLIAEEENRKFTNYVFEYPDWLLGHRFDVLAKRKTTTEMIPVILMVIFLSDQLAPKDYKLLHVSYDDRKRAEKEQNEWRVSILKEYNFKHLTLESICVHFQGMPELVEAFYKERLKGCSPNRGGAEEMKFDGQAAWFILSKVIVSYGRINKYNDYYIDLFFRHLHRIAQTEDNIRVKKHVMGLTNASTTEVDLKFINKLKEYKPLLMSKRVESFEKRVRDLIDIERKHISDWDSLKSATNWLASLPTYE